MAGMVARNKHGLRVIAGIAGVLVIALLVLPASVGAGPARQGTPPASSVQAVIAVERVSVFPTPQRTAQPFSYLYERERTPVFARSADGVWLLTEVSGVEGWILSAQVDLEGDPALIPVVTGASPTPTLTMTPFALITPTRLPESTAATLAPVLTPADQLTTEDDPAASADEAAMPVLPGAPPPVEITLPPGWKSVDLIVPYRTFENTAVRDVPLTIYSGPLANGGQGIIYLYWGFPSTIDLASGNHNLWADGVQILRFSLIGPDCNLGVYDQRKFPIGAYEGVGAYYQAAQCPAGESDTAGWFAVLRLYDGGFGFFVAVEPPESLTSQRAALQAILDTVTFVPPDAE